MHQAFVWKLTLILVGLLAALFLWAIRSSAQQGDAAQISQAATRWRRNSFWLLLVTLTPVALWTLGDMPYAQSAPAVADPMVVDAVGRQWRWELSTQTLPAGRPIEFRVRAEDVNHGFAIYDDRLQLHTQVQAMPGVTNVLRYTFDKPGTYSVLCLEYCGVAHHNMTTQLTVVAQN